MSKVLQLFAQTRINGEFTEFSNDPSRIVKKAETDKKLYGWKKDIHICMYKTNYEGSNSIAMFIVMELPGSSTGSGSASDMIFDNLEYIEKMFIPIDYIHIDEIKGNSKNISVLTIVKKVREIDML